MIDALRARSPSLPIFVLADRSSVEALSIEVPQEVSGCIWKLEDTPTFVASRVEEARREYLEPLLPPSFEALVLFTKKRATHHQYKVLVEHTHAAGAQELLARTPREATI